MEKVPDMPDNINLDDPRFRIRPYQQIIASCTGALITSVFVTPLDVVKTRLQAQQKATLSNKCFLYCNGLMDHLCPCINVKSPNEKFTGTMDAFIKISKREGISSLWSGLSPTLVLAVPATVAYFVSYEQLKIYFKDKYNRHLKQNVSNVEQPFWIPMLAGGTARIWAAVLVKMTEALKILIRNSGVSGLWMGLGSTLFRDVPFSAIYWFHYETLKKMFPESSQNFSFNLAAGATAGSVAALFTLPFDVVKTHRQIEMGEKTIYSDKPISSRSTTLTIIRKIYDQNGIKGLYTGLIPRLIKVAPACAIMIATFEHAKRFFQKHNANKALEFKHNVYLIQNERNGIK
ncbi:hypothetical protein M0802_008615 [Mischocyttarus mexicanus]|nr:hypothetical protein M0802_008615 [Mischocyttarus mexicanus]